ncbi:segregation and condensation protein A [Companilactobacillus furfuricola]|uniref:segregation and condensation protein A n=1 Tax=Companilactobacillus furfuricola TaxID=1462575 RepID=UPI000F76D3A5|nr:segregation/condensation protein A [Companilactobacillus furfuricola]
MEKLKLVLTDFQGPIDLLLHLIKESKIDIYDIPIADITQQYLDYLNNMKVLQLDIAGDYLVMASTLMSIKSKMLLPKAPDEMEDDVFEEDPRDELVSQLLTYQTFKRVADYFSDKEKQRARSFDKEPSVSSKQLEQFLLPGSVVLSDLASVYTEILQNQIKHGPKTEMIEDEEISIEMAQETILSKLKKHKIITFKSLLKVGHGIEEVVTDFMAILEMVRNQQVLAHQEDFQSELFIELRN